MIGNKFTTFYHKADDTFSIGVFAYQLNFLIEEHKKKYGPSPILFLCIGSDRVTGDCLGPLIGYKLSNIQEFLHVPIFGTLQEPVHAINLKDTLHTIKMEYQNPLIIAIDASIGDNSHIGYITLSNRSLRPGLGVEKDLPEVGHITITGIVGDECNFHSSFLHHTPLSLVMSLADCIFYGLSRFFGYDKWKLPL